MNQLSLLLYAADVLPTLAVLGAILGTLFTLVVIIITLVSWAIEPRDMSEGFRTDHQRIKKSFSYMAAVGFILATFIPEPTTFYLIAASEGTQLAMENPESQKMFGSVKDIIQLKLDQVVEDLKETAVK